MKTKLALFPALSASLLFSTTVSAIEIKPLSKKELIPFCQNTVIWGQFNISEKQCLEVAVPCSKITIKPGMNMMNATEALYSCTFSKLGIEIPEPPEDDDDEMYQDEDEENYSN